VTCTGDVLELFGIDPVEAPRAALGPTASALSQQNHDNRNLVAVRCRGLSSVVRQGGFD
jgi:hypothetical protein